MPHSIRRALLRTIGQLIVFIPAAAVTYGVIWVARYLFDYGGVLGFGGGVVFTILACILGAGTVHIFVTPPKSSP